MRKYFAKVVDADGHPDFNDNHVEIREKPFPTLEKGEEGIVQRRNMDTNEAYEMKMIGLGYHDFEDEDKYEEKLNEVIAEKLDEQGIEHHIGEEQ